MRGYRSLGGVVVFSLIYFFPTIASAADTLYFKGKIKVSKNVSYNYSLRFTVNKSLVTGYSLSDPGGPTETKTKISGTYDSVNNILSFEEKSVLRSKVDLQKNFLCFVKASLRLKRTKLIEELTGKFIGTEPGKATECATGEIKMINTNMVISFLKQKNVPPPPDSTKTTTAETKKDKELPTSKTIAVPETETIPTSKANTIMVADAKGKEFLITGNKIKLTIWDNGEVDGDRISILLNDKYILEDYMVTFSAKIIDVTLSDNAIDTVKIIAHNEGTLPPNTAAIKIESKLEQYPIITKANLNEIRTIYLRKK
ncbi:MAG: hypothetical protein ABIN97_15625 [Ginsengibacter sp.]